MRSDSFLLFTPYSVTLLPAVKYCADEVLYSESELGPVSPKFEAFVVQTVTVSPVLVSFRVVM